MPCGATQPTYARATASTCHSTPTIACRSICALPPASAHDRCLARISNPLQSVDLVVLAGIAELGQALFQEIAQERRAQKIARAIAERDLAGLVARLLPVFARIVAAADPGEGDQVQRLVVVQGAEGARHFLEGRIIGEILEHIDLVVV